MDKRDHFLIHMYQQMFADIDQHVGVVWQSIGTVAASIGLLALAEKNILPIDVSVSLIVLLSGWLVANVFEASYWYNRNLVIIANIERQFLAGGDDKLIHYYFKGHRKNNVMIGQLALQKYLAISVALIMTAYHFSERVFPGFKAGWDSFELTRSLPYLVLIVVCLYLRFQSVKKLRSYEDFIERSPGAKVGAGDISESIGHGQSNGFRDNFMKAFFPWFQKDDKSEKGASQASRGRSEQSRVTKNTVPASEE